MNQKLPMNKPAELILRLLRLKPTNSFKIESIFATLESYPHIDDAIPSLSFNEIHTAAKELIEEKLDEIPHPLVPYYRITKTGLDWVNKEHPLFKVFYTKEST